MRKDHTVLHQGLSYQKLRLVLQLIAICIISGCAQDKIRNSSFQWDNSRPIPVAREATQKDWMPYYNYSKMVVEDSVNTEKPILCYISQYTAIGTRDIEEKLIGRKDWVSLFKKYFVLIEINWWDDPVLALSIAGQAGHSLKGKADGIPGIYIIRPSGNSFEAFKAIDYWSGSDFMYFPFHTSQAFDKSDSGSIGRELNRLASNEGITVGYGSGGLSTYGLQNLRDSMASYSGRFGQGDYGPEIVLYYTLGNLATEQREQGLASEVETWATDIHDSLNPSLISGSGFLYIPYLTPKIVGLSVDVLGNLQAMECAQATGSDYPVPPSAFFDGLFKMVIGSNGSFQGGFAPYIASSTQLTGPDNDSSSLISKLLTPDDHLNSILGPQDIIWVNVKVLSSILKIIMNDPELGKILKEEDETIDEFVALLTDAMMQGIEDKINIEDPFSIRIIDRMYLLDLYNTLYKKNGDRSYLDKAQNLAATFSQDSRIGTFAATVSYANPDEWFDLAFIPFVPDLAISLYDFGSLKGDDDAKFTAQYLVENSLKLMLTPASSIVAAKLAYALEVVKADAIRIIIIGPDDDNDAMQLLKTGNRGWDPRKTAQVIDLYRDEDLIERFGLDPTETPTAFIFIDEELYAQTTDPAQLQDIIKEVQEKLSKENTE